MMDGFIQLFHVMEYKLDSSVDELELWLVWGRETFLLQWVCLLLLIKYVLPTFP